ncbi:TPA: hypothetical protein ACUNF5_007398 [Burkholderia orbicola]|uniref:response regulator transcription factor n=1 Tax=Burkholderia orbicola TaxID=2978683 RepID=UPI00264C78E2|nr:response regulator transcription factor [Burkholderia orbicola]MDN7535628.1 response regulator transcription factor [Burkholderia orbicola]
MSYPYVIRTAIFDGQPCSALGIATFLSKEAGCEISCISHEPELLLDSLTTERVDLILLDYQAFVASGFGLRKIKSSHPDIKIIATASNSFDLIEAASIKAGADGFYKKCDEISNLRRIILSVSNGLGRSIVPNKKNGVTTRLSRGELEALLACLSGISVSDFARRKGRSVKTVSRQKRIAYQKLGISTDLELFRDEAILRVSGILDAAQY